MNVAPLLAAGNDWVVGLMTILIPVGIWVLNRVFAQLNQAGQQPPGQRPRAAPPPGVPAPEDEVQEFLKRVRQRREGSESIQVVRPEQPASSSATPRPGAERPRRERGQRKRGQSAPSTTRERPRPQPPQPQPATRKPFGSRLSEQVAADMDTTDVTDHADHLTDLDQADEQMEAHIQSAFSHKLGQLESSMQADEATEKLAAAELAATPTLAALLRTQLATQTGLRQAVMLREILDRPTHRW